MLTFGLWRLSLLFIGEPLNLIVGELGSAKIDLLYGSLTGSSVDTYLSFLFLAFLIPPPGISILKPLNLDASRSSFEAVLLLLPIDAYLFIPKAFVWPVV